MLCVLILHVSGGTYSLKSTPNDSFLRNFFMAILFHSQSFCQKSAERKSPKKYFLYFCYDVWPVARTQATTTSIITSVGGSMTNNLNLSFSLYSQQVGLSLHPRFIKSVTRNI